MRDTIATDDLTDSDSFLACLDSEMLMKFMTSTPVMIFSSREAEFPRRIGVFW